MNPRVQRLKSRLQVEKYPICIEKFKIAMETIEESEKNKDSQMMMRAKIFANTLDKISLFIPEDEPFAGEIASKPFGLEVNYEYGAWTQDEIDSLKSEQYSITPDEEVELQKLNDRLGDRNLISAMGEMLGDKERLWPFMKSGVVLPPWKGKQGSGGGYAQSGLGLGPGLVLIAVEFEKILNEGCLKIIADAETELKNLRYFSANALEKEDFLKSVIVTHKAVIRFAERYAKLAAEMAAKETRPERKKDLERMAAACSHVPANPSRNFFEALQAFWFTFIMISPSPTTAAGRFDQYMYPFYKKDKAAGQITDEEVLELLECLRMKDMQMNRVSGKMNRKKNAGMAKWHNWTIGGVDPVTGKDATNELSYLLLEAAKDTQVPHNTVTLRIHENTPEDLIVKGLEVVRTGLGIPAFVSDDSYIKFFMKNGVSLEDARNYVMTGCLDGNIPGKSRTIDFSFFIVALAFEIFMHNGVSPYSGEMVGIETGNVEDFKTFEEFQAAFYKQMGYLLDILAEKNNITLLASRELFPDPFKSSLLHDALKEGRDFMKNPMPFENASLVCPVGTINTADSLAVVKKLVFDEKKVTMAQLKAALAANWEGYEDLRKMCLAVPKYGNDEDYVDHFAVELYAYLEKTLAQYDTIYGGKVLSTAISITSHQPGGMMTGATPDGRHAGEILADGSMSPTHGMDLKGPLAVLKSAMKIDQDSYQATLLNMKFHPSALKTEEDLKKLASMIKTYFANGGKHVQFNVVDKETLMVAKDQPDQHRDLVVRVAGYSAYFVTLGNEMQNEIIERTGFEEVK